MYCRITRYSFKPEKYDEMIASAEGQKENE